MCRLFSPKQKVNAKKARSWSPNRILSLSPYVTNLEYRPIEGAVAVHEKEAEIVYVIDGGGTLTTGGTVVGQKRTNATNLSGTSIDGGTSTDNWQRRFHDHSGKHAAPV